MKTVPMKHADFAIEWNKEIPDVNDKPATETEINSAMSKIRARAKHVKLGSVIELDLRSEVAEAVAWSINKTGSGFATVNPLEHEKPEFNIKLGYVVSNLAVTKDKMIFDAWMTTF